MAAVKVIILSCRHGVRGAFKFFDRSKTQSSLRKVKKVTLHRRRRGRKEDKKNRLKEGDFQRIQRDEKEELRSTLLRSGAGKLIGSTRCKKEGREGRNLSAWIEL